MVIGLRVRKSTLGKPRNFSHGYGKIKLGVIIPKIIFPCRHFTLSHALSL